MKLWSALKETRLFAAKLKPRFWVAALMSMPLGPMARVPPVPLAMETPAVGATTVMPGTVKAASRVVARFAVEFESNTTASLAVGLEPSSQLVSTFQAAEVVPVQVSAEAGREARQSAPLMVRSLTGVCMCSFSIAQMLHAEYGGLSLFHAFLTHGQTKGHDLVCDLRV